MRKLFLSLILSLLVFVAYAEGISNYKELLAFAKAVNKEADISMWQNKKGEVYLTADIDMKKGKKFPTIKAYNGVFDGRGHKLYNWNAKSSLFGALEVKAVVKNLIIDASCKLEVTTSLNEEHEYIAYIAKINKGKIANCINHGSVEHNGNEANKEIMIGAIAACNHNIIYYCMNTGAISSRINFSNKAGGKCVRMGGIAGTCHGEGVVKGTTISRCVNTGNVSFMGDYPNNNIGGIVGESSKTTVKNCVNRGNVVAVGMPFAGKQKPASRVGGITALSNVDIVSCDNFGVVTVSGTHASTVGGICARLNFGLTMVDCVNYGKISANTSGKALVGGVFGETSRPVHVSQCYNYAEVVSESAEGTSCCGGFAGAVSLGKNPTGSYFRDCANYGNVTNKSTKSKSATGGFVASCRGYAKENLPVTIRDCANSGEISAALDTNSGDMCGVKSHTNVVGQRYDDFVKSVKPLKDGSNIFGRVTDTKGNPVAGVVVSDGEQSVKTDINGEYAMKSNLANVRFVMISVPADYEIQLRENRPQFFRRVPRYIQGARADFVLSERKTKSDNFVLAMIGDPQTRGFKSENALERFRDVIVSDLKELSSATKEDIYAICLGDLVYNYMTAYDDYMDVLATSPVPMVSVIGNHDYDQRTLFESKLGTAYFESYLAPLNYSFNIGKIHFVVVNDILYNREYDKQIYKTGLEDYTIEWLENDLKHIPKTTTIVICSHAPLMKWRTNLFAEKSVNYKKYSELLSQYDNVYAWAGHTHQNYDYDYGKGALKESSLKNIKSIVVARSVGMIRLNRELNTCGTPNGYVVAEVKGDKMEWYYKTAGHDRNYQMRAYAPTYTDSEYVKVNIWNYSADTWSAIEWWENGQKVAEMEHAEGEFDPDYLKIYAEHQQQKLDNTERKYSKPVASPYLFRVKPSAGVRDGEIRVTDGFGVTYTQRVSW
jgi:hypothetical protein